MKTYYVLWTYGEGTHLYYSNLLTVEAESPEDAVKTITSFYSEDFQKKATVYVWDSPPCLISPIKNEFPASKEECPECPKCPTAQERGEGCECGMPIASDWQLRAYRLKHKVGEK